MVAQREGSHTHWKQFPAPVHITPEAPLSALKSAIAENGMGVTSRP